jgi:hypothetical protein
MKILLISFLYFTLPYVNSIVMYPVMRAATNIQRILHPLNPLPKATVLCLEWILTLFFFINWLFVIYRLICLDWL